MRKVISTAIALSLGLALSACTYTPPSHPQYGAQTWLSLTALTGTKDPAINGAAIARYFEGGRYAMNVQLNVEVAPPKKAYNVWVQKQDGSDRVNLGELMSPTGDVRHVLTFNSEKDLRDFTVVIVTLQDDGKTEIPAEPVAKGTLEVPKQ